MLWASLAAQWLRLCASTAGDTGSVPAQGSSTCREVRPEREETSALVPPCVPASLCSPPPGVINGSPDPGLCGVWWACMGFGGLVWGLVGGFCDDGQA